MAYYLLGGILLFFFGLGENPSSLWAKEGKTPPKARLIQIEDQMLPDRLRVILKINRPVVISIFHYDQSPSAGGQFKPMYFRLSKTLYREGFHSRQGYVFPSSIPKPFELFSTSSKPRSIKFPIKKERLIKSS